MLSSLVERLNDRRRADEEVGEDAGFTLIELMVVLLIMAILLAIAIPTFLGVTGSANDRAAQSNLNTALTNAKSFYQSNGQTFISTATSTSTTSTSASSALVSAMSTQEPSVTWTTGDSSASGVISVYVDSDGNGVVLAALSKTNVCWLLVDNETVETTAPAGITGSQLNAGTWYGGWPNASATTCTADVASAPTGIKWNAAGTAGFPGGLP
jgi:type IV pilus assembly protein PilA